MVIFRSFGLILHWINVHLPRVCRSAISFFFSPVTRCDFVKAVKVKCVRNVKTMCRIYVPNQPHDHQQMTGLSKLSHKTLPHFLCIILMHGFCKKISSASFGFIYMVFLVCRALHRCNFACKGKCFSFIR